MSKTNRKIGFAARYFYSLMGCCYLFMAGFAFKKHRLLISDICSHFGYAEESNGSIASKSEEILPKIEISDVVPPSTFIQIFEPIAGKGDISLLELTVLAKFIRHCQPEKIFEFGTFQGRTTLNLAANSPEGSRVYTLDLPRGQRLSTKWPLAPGEEIFVRKETIGSRYAGWESTKKIVQLYGDSATYDFVPFHGIMDLIFIDGSHAYEYVLNDSKAALVLLKKDGGVVFWHDYGRWEGVTRALNHLFSAAEGFKGLTHVNGTTLAYWRRDRSL